MSILDRPLGLITVADLDALVEAGARETTELEFKGTLPFKRQKGQPEIADRWIEKGDRVGDLARDEILSELVAFANADGGTLILGLHETKIEPRVADRLEALPRCEALALRLLSAAEDTIEPRLPTIAAQAVPADEDGGGYVVLRVARSYNGPHRLRSTRDFYVRRGERAAVMDVREIKDLTLDLARTGDRIEETFAKRRAVAFQRWKLVGGPRGLPNAGACLIRVSAVPLIPRQIPQLTGRRDLWWFSDKFELMVDERKLDGDYPSRDFGGHARPRLRAFEMEPDDPSDGTRRLLQGDGLVEFTLTHPLRMEKHPREGTSVFFGWVGQLITGVLCQVETLRQKLGWGNLPYGLEVEIRGMEPLTLFLKGSRETSAFGRRNVSEPVILPRLEIGSAAGFDQVLSAILLDASNAWQQHWEASVTAPWERLLCPSR